MIIGMNLTEPAYYMGPVPWANVVWSTTQYQRMSDFAFHANQRQGLIIDTALNDVGTATDTCVAIVAHTSQTLNLPGGTYTWRNPDALEIGIGSALATPPNILNFTHGLSGTFVLNANSPLYLFTKGNVTNTGGNPQGGIQIILPNHVTTWDAGDYLNADFVNFHSALGTSVLRTMDWTGTNANLEENWSDAPKLSGINFRGTYNLGVPWEGLIALANRLNKPLWINVPVRATDGYVSSLAALVSATYTVPTLYVEYGNEIWNTATSFIRNTLWAGQFQTHTKYSAAAAGNVFTIANHGWATGKSVRCFMHKQQLERQDLGDDFTNQGWETTISISAITANTFKLVNNGTEISLADGVTSLYIVDPTEAGKSTDENQNYAARAKQIWDIFDAHLDATNISVKAVLGGYFENTFMTDQRTSAVDIAARCDYFAIAPYFYGVHFMGARGRRASGLITPEFFCNANCTVYAYVYTANAAPTIGDIKAGTGAVGGSTFTHTVNGTAYTTGSAVGVLNGTTYKIHIAATDPNSYTWTWSGNVSASATVDTVTVNDTFENQKWRALLRIDNPSGGTHNLANQAANQLGYLTPKGIELAAYEGGSHDDSSTTALPDAVLSWKESWFEDSAYGATLVAYFRQAACAGYKVFTHFRDMSNQGGPWAIADDNTDTADARFVAIKALSGSATIGAVLSIQAVSGVRVNDDPVVYPHKVHSFTAQMTYTLIQNNDGANYTISSQAIELLNGTGINYAVSANHRLRIHATNGASFDFFNFSLNVGTAVAGSTWFEADALWAWNSSADTSATQMDPDAGNVIPPSTGVAADVTIANGLWKPGNAGFNGSLAMVASASTPAATGLPFLLTIVANAGTYNPAGNTVILRVGGFPLIQVLATSDGNPAVGIQYHNGVSAEELICGSLDATSRAYWFYFDPVNNLMRYGNNQTLLNTNLTAGVAPAHSFPAALTQDIWYDNNSWNIGTTEVVNRGGLGITAALAIVQKVQDVHGL